jgi:hypothetical protein
MGALSTFVTAVVAPQPALDNNNSDSDSNDNVGKRQVC